MRSVGPFELTETEFEGLKMLLQADNTTYTSPITDLACTTFGLRDWTSYFNNENYSDTGESGETAEVEAQALTLERSFRRMGEGKH